MRDRAIAAVLAAGLLVVGCESEPQGAAVDAQQGTNAGGPGSDATDAQPSSGDVTDAGPSGDDAATAPDSAGVDAGPDVAPLVCNPGSAWTGQAAFTDRTDEMGLGGETPIAGIRLSAADLDGDGYPDLVVRGHAQGEHESFEPGATRRTFVLMNREGPDGGRRFEDTTQLSGFLALPDGGEGRTAHIVVFGDVDNDGDLDAFSGVAVNPDPTKPDNGDRNEVLLNDGTGHFTLAPGGDVRHETKRYTAGGASFLDIDRDGVLDLFVGYGNGVASPDLDRVYLGDGAGAFTDVTLVIGLKTLSASSVESLNTGHATRNTWGVTVCDVNGDGHADLLSSSYGRAWNGLWIGGSDGGTPRFEDRTAENGFGMDDRMDWSTNLNAQCYCTLEPEAEGCAGVPAPPSYFGCTSTDTLRWNHAYDREPFRLGGNTFSTACGDVDNDGDMDLLNLEIVHWDVGPSSDPSELLLNDGSGVFSRPGVEAMGLARTWEDLAWNAGDMTGALFDFDNDGRKDVYIGSSDYPGTRGFLFRQGAAGTFEEVPPSLGIDQPRSHGIAVADFDRDGDLDVVVGHGTSRCSGDPTCHPTQEVHYFQNDLGHLGNYLQLRLTGAAGTNRAAIGARVEITAGGVTQVQEVGGGYGHYGIQNDLVLHFGLGDACTVDEVRVRWPDGALSEDVWTDVPANSRLDLEQGGARAVRF